MTATRVVVNRMRSTLGWTERDITEMLADFARLVGLHFLPDDRASVDRALVTGRTLLETDAEGPLAVAVDRIAATLLTGAEPGEERRLRRRTAGRARPR